MPFIATSLNTSLYEKIKALVEQGLYTSPEQFLEIAAFNQVALEKGIQPAQIVARGHRNINITSDQESTPGPATTTSRPQQAKRPKRGASRVPGREKAGRRVQSEGTVDVFSMLSLAGCQGALPQPIDATLRPATELVWGQVNRLFPLKLACRWLAVVNTEKSKWEHHHAIAEKMPLDAASLGSLLESQDAVAGRKRDELLSTGLPRRGNPASVDRFLSQFIARTTRSGEIYPGAICQYSLAEFDGDRLALTDRGIVLARLRNPILDEDPARSASSLSDEERGFFTHQVLLYVPGELREIRHVLGTVLGGSNTPEQLLAAVRSLLPQEWSDVMARTHVSGVVARLTDMGLLRRRWEGRNVNYEAATVASTLMRKEQIGAHDQAD